MKWSELKTRVCKPFGGSHLSDAELFLEDAERDLGIFAKCYKRTFVTLLDEFSNNFALPSDFIEMDGRPDYNGDLLDRYTEVGYASNKTSSTTFETGHPQYYRIEGNKMVVVPKPTSAQLLRFQYVAVPTKHTSSTAYKALRYKSLSGEGYQIGDVVEGRVSGSLSTATASGKVLRDDSNGDGTGTLILSNITTLGSYTGFRNGDTLVTIDPEEDAYASNSPYGYGYTFDQLIQNWDNIGLGGKATIEGTEYALSGTSNNIPYGKTVGESPVIPEPFHYLMIEFAQARIYDMLGQSADADRHYNRYYQNRIGLAGITANQDFGGPTTVIDAL
jgi:hypothetical protein|tara:strand:+ start:16685 stop:17680 length:996 start_codon:yes stop_codon:yes gene_type:complete